MAKTNQYATVHPQCANVHWALVVGRREEAVCDPSSSTEVWIVVIAARPTADPSHRAELKIAPTMPATDGGVEAKIAILNERDENRASGSKVSVMLTSSCCTRSCNQSYQL